MSTQPPWQKQWLNIKTFCGFLACLLLSGCGGGGGSNGTTSSLSDSGVDTSSITFEGQVVDEFGAPYSGAEVSVPLGPVIYTEFTDDNGNYSLRVPANEVPDLVVLSIWQVGRSPQVRTWADLAPGATAVLTAPATLPQLGPGEKAFSEAVFVRHLGDDSFSGAENSQLQTQSIGTYWVNEFTVSQVDIDQGNQFIVSMLIRGVQGSICPQDQIGLWQFDEATQTQTNAIPFVQNLGDSDPNGGYSNALYAFNTSNFLPGRRTFLSINSGACSGSDFDDFEFVQVVGQFQ